MAFAVGYRGATVFENKKYTLTSGFLSLFAYMLLVPLDTTTLADSGISFFYISYPLGKRIWECKLLYRNEWTIKSRNSTYIYRGEFIFLWKQSLYRFRKYFRDRTI